MIKTNKISLRSQESQELLKSQLVTQKSIDSRNFKIYRNTKNKKIYSTLERVRTSDPAIHEKIQNMPFLTKYWDNPEIVPCL